MPYMQLQLWNGVRAPFLTFESTNSTITPSIILSGDGPCQWEVTEADGTKYYYNTNGFTHNRVFAGNMTVRLLNTMQVAPYVTAMDFTGDGIISDYRSIILSAFQSLSSVSLLLNSVTGNISQLRFLPSYRYVYFLSDALTGSISDLVLNNGLLYFYLTGSPLITGSPANWVLPTTLQRLRLLGCTQVNGDLSTMVLNSALQWFHVNSTAIIKGAVIPASTAMQQYYIQDCGLSQAAVDAIILNAYTNRAGFTYATPTFNVGDTNSAPSGIYQFANPPTTGKEMIYWLVNDPLAEGFNKQVWTYTA